MQLSQRIDALAALGNYLKSYSDDELAELARKATYYNPWFTEENVKFAFAGILKFLEEESLKSLAAPYGFKETYKTVGIIMAGNVPMVGFHDLLCVLLSGNKAMVKLSSKDEVLPKFFISRLKEVAPELAESVIVVEKLENFDAIIATGSNNTSRYFEYYFGKYPHIIRKNRTSVAVLTGNEADDELQLLSDDILLYFGMGCRNVSKIFVPENYNFEPLFVALEKYKDVSLHNKYVNNYDYYKSIYLINGDKFYDTGFIMFKEDSLLVSPVGVVYFEFYNDINEVKNHLLSHQDKIQVIVASKSAGMENTVPFGKAQLPEVDDFADRVDTMDFLTSLS